MKHLKRFAFILALVFVTTGCWPWIYYVDGPLQVSPNEAYEISFFYALIYHDIHGYPFAVDLYIEAHDGTISIPEPLPDPFLRVTGNGTSNVRASIRNTFEGTLGNIFFTPSPSSASYYRVSLFITAGSTLTSSSYSIMPRNAAPITAASVVTPLTENQPPVNSAPSALTVQEGDSVLVPMSVSDPDMGMGFYDVRLSVSLGTLTTVSSVSADDIVEGIGTNQLYIKSTQARIGTYLSQVVYTPIANAPATDTLTILTNDRGNNGAGGQKTATDTVTMTIEPAPPPLVNNISATTNSNEGAGGGLSFAGGAINCVVATTCGGSVSASGGTPPYTYQWAGGNTPEVFRTISPDGGYVFEFMAEQVGSYSWSIQATDGSGATATATFTIAVAP